jgi:FkbM family methyltransferase
MQLVPGDVISDYIAFTGEYEPHLTRRVIALARKGGTLLDVGANLGYFALLWAATNPVNKCIAIEASPRNVELLRRNVRRNKFDAQIEIIPRAAGRTPGKVRFDPGPAGQTGWGGIAPQQCEGAIDVDVVRVDDLVSSSEPIALLKVDIEGADAWALMGCERLFNNKLVEEIWYEENKPRMRCLGISPGTSRDYLRTVGYIASPQSDPNAELVEWSAVQA